MLGEGYSAAGHRNRFRDIRRVRSSNRELGTRSAARTRSAKLLYYSSHPEGTLGFLHLTQAVWGAAELVITGIDPQTSDASACRIQRSELGFILELDWKTVRLFC